MRMWPIQGETTTYFSKCSKGGPPSEKAGFENPRPFAHRRHLAVASLANGPFACHGEMRNMKSHNH